MKRIVKLSMVAGAGLIALALAASLLPMGRPRAQEGGVTPDRGPAPAEPGPVYPEDAADAASATLQVAGAVLRPENSADVEWAVPVAGTPGCIYAVSGDPDGYWNAPIHPPQGATLTKMVAFVYDASDAADGEAVIGVVDAYGNWVVGWGETSSGSSGSTYVEIPIPNHQVDPDYSYLLWWQPGVLGADMKICGFRLYYTPAGGTNYLPSVRKDK
jgi:hypothetical protein